MKKSNLILVILALLSACSVPIKPVAIQKKTINKPELNIVNKEELGNTLVEFYISNTQPSINVLESFGYNSKHKIFPPQILKPVGQGERISKFIIENTPNGNPASSFTRGICYDTSDSIFFIPSGFDTCDLTFKAMNNSGPIKVESADYIDVNSPQFRQELIYNGKVGSSVKFLYRELSSGHMRSPFTQDIQYDLNEGNVIGFKGARIEIINSTNRFIEYKVLKMFDRK